MKFLKYKTKNFRKIKILSNYKKSRRRKYLETVIEIDHKIIIIFKIIFLIFFIYFDITLFTKIKIKPITKVSQTIFNEMKSYEDMHKNISLEEYTLIITADHGNCEVMRNKDGSINTSHTTNKVPFIVTDKKIKLLDGNLSDIAPTILYLMGLEIPKEMTGNILIKRRGVKRK